MVEKVSGSEATRRRLKPLVITMGSDRQSYIEQLFSHPEMAKQFEPPAFSAGIPSRSLRNRMKFFRIVHEAGLLPPEEWEALVAAQDVKEYQDNPERMFECLRDVPVLPGRRGSTEDVKLHYSVELWRKAKGLNRGRAILACALAHLLAMKRCVAEGYDFILEDNVRAPPNDCADRIWATLEASKDWELQHNEHCHLRYYGWLGSIPNLKWVLNTHSKRKAHVLSTAPDKEHPGCSVFPFPVPEDFDTESLEESDKECTETPEQDQAKVSSNGPHQKPGGTAIWGAYAYWISSQGLDCLLSSLRNDVGSLLWKGKRMRCHVVKPIDKVLPRQIISLFGQQSVHVTTHPAFFRAPMLSSKLHSQWDAEFCKSTSYQLECTGLNWSDLWLTNEEEAVIEHSKKSCAWLTMEKLAQLQVNGEKCAASQVSSTVDNLSAG